MARPDARPEARDALLEAARDLRARRRIPEALATLARLQAMHPRFSRLYHERGHCHVLLGQAPAAIEALREAVRLNPTLPASWDMLEQLHRMLGQTAEAAAAAAHLALLRQLPPEVVVANSLFADGDLPPAEAVIRDYLRNDPDNVGALRLLARLCTEREALAEAEALLEAVLERAPDYHAARLDYAVVLLQRQKHWQARQEAERLLRHDPDNREYLKQYGAACVGLGDHEPVIDLYARLLAGQPSSGQASSGQAMPRTEVAELRLWRANALKIIGRRQEAIADYRAALAARRDYGVAWFSLANLKTYRFADDDIALMREAEARPGTQEMDRVYLCFALGKALEDRGEHASSWRYYERGNALRRAASRYRPEIAQACALRSQRAFTAEFFGARAGWGVDDPAPIFIVGLPRSGSTLVEQILASHSRVEGTQELTEIGRYAGELCGSDPDCGLPLHPEALLRLTASEARALGERFLAETRAYRRLGRPLFIDKMPNNFWHIGLIHLILPRATIIDVRREPMACCFGNLKQLFGTTNQEFAYGIDDIARHYRLYLDLMRHWDDVLPGRVLRVHYEDVVEDLDGSVRRLLAHGDLPFEPACLAFHQTRRSVRTPSSEQVRQPIGREGLTQWCHYAPWLAPLRHALGDALTGYRA
ncbi:tetratricopeptide repeat-containing sulfotransferase family protein [Novosphingobium album (ex Liu et al. 2023)]|uniref:Sulfotransferase n=1 Tax=Novosphingobium album (ex Liu et al. 2023) TaxID=3031130 RepID=A0ABT5WLT8_9SPHN|nr:tetratricopeptide repeat-containing sulfotransferase family protein [Novosphingobium album (ex Liu et al. 2023)]MDE8651005.1 sulfotransferase [Novosphingobium album (ex Liu et al. 2023)]